MAPRRRKSWYLLLAVAILAGVASPPRLAADNGVAQLMALRDAYPEQITELAYRDDDWAILVRGEWIYWAHGRLLPQKARSEWARYQPYRFYDYMPGPEVPPAPDAEEVARLVSIVYERSAALPSRHNGFPAALYGIRSGGSAPPHLVSTHLLGHRFTVHRMVEEPLERVRLDIERAAKRDPTIGEFIDTLDRVGGYFRRTIAGTSTVSYHGYGVAIDLIPRRLYDSFAYWRFAMLAGIEHWWAVPTTARWHVPPAIVAAFEAHGFIWGGKWTLFDTMHFEYRPELRLFNARYGAERDRPAPHPDGEARQVAMTR